MLTASKAMENNPATGNNNATTPASQPASEGVGTGPPSAPVGSLMAYVAIVRAFLPEIGITGETVDRASWV